MLARFAGLIAALVILAILVRVGFGDSGMAEGSTLKTLMVPVASLYLNTFNSPVTAITLCLVMVVLGIGLLLYYWLAKLGPVRSDLRDAAEELRAVGLDGSRESFDKVDAILLRHGTVSRGWVLYRATLVQNGERIGSSVPSARYFSLRMLESAGVRLRFFLGLPNDFIGIGLIFTFLGLVAGLYFASRSMMSADLGVARDALVQLLHAATFKFLTSITGITLSLVINWAQTILVGRLNAQLDEIQFLIEERFPMRAAVDALVADMPATTAAPPPPAKQRREAAKPFEMARPV